VVRDLHEIDTRKFLNEQINHDINKFRNAEAFVNAGRERMQGGVATNGAQKAAGSAADIMEEIAERDSPRGANEEEFDDAASSLSKELMLAK